MMHLVIAMTMVFQQATKGKRHTSLIERGDCIRMESIKGAFVKYDSLNKPFVTPHLQRNDKKIYEPITY